ncbi:DNRLRE domain-containing protein [Nocardiopsis valliformis]|uniref:DNRLRE domain-containing protein n=1 Tax=Nocardiopsis valliformis TaxID=239974 RepID=UPI0023A9AB30|nr:DNRLRE domain-containing protein [Nocardiopsis valliformis]
MTSVPANPAMPRLTPVSAADVETPDQNDGTAEGLSHEAESALVHSSSEPTGAGPNADAPDGALSYEWPDLPEDADTLAPPDLESPATPLAEEEPEPRVTGFDPETSVELVEERDEYSRTFENEDGTHSTDFSQEPLHFEAEDGSWQKLDPSLVPENTLTWTSAAGAKEVSFAANADADELARMELEEGYSLSFSLEGAAGAQGEVLEDEPDTIVYPEALPGTDIELKSLKGGGVKETIWIHDLPETAADAVWRFPLEIEGLEPVLLEDGSIDLVDDEGESVGHIPAGYMEDSDIDPRSGDGAWSEAVDFELLREGEGWVLQVSADFDWLTDDERVYPVAVDPTSTWNYNASQDTYVQTGFNTSRYTEQELKAGTYNGGSTRAASYLRFNAMVNELSNHKIYGAKLHLFNHWSYSCTPSPVYVHEVTQSWSQKSISNFPGPSYNSTALGSASFARGWMPAGASSSSCPARYEGIDLGTRGRNLVQAWVDGDKPNHGITVRASNTSNSGWKKFGSRESWGAPYMTVTYSPYRADYAFAQSPPEFDPAPHATRGTNVDVRVTNRGDATWTPTNGYELGYQVFDKDGKRVYHVAPTTKMPRNVATGQSATVRAKIDPLPPGTWTIRFDMTHKAQSFAAWGVPMTAQVQLEIPDLPPQLLDYSPRDGARVATLTPEFTALGRNNDAWPTDDMEFWFNFCDGEWPDWECVDSGWQEETSWQLPDDRMEWGNQYWWNVFVRDGSQNVESGWLRLIAEPDQPAITANLASGGSGEHGTVNALIGNYTQTVTDAAVPVAGPPLSVTRTYNSSDPRQDGMFGAGWSTRFDMRLVQDVDGTGNVVMTYPGGSQHRFARNADGSFSPPSGMHAVLAETDSGWRLMDKASTSYVFDDTGRLLEVTDHRGRSQTIAYDTSGQIATVTSGGGRSLDFTWSDGRVSSVTARGGDDSAEWTYVYDGQRLIEACNPEQECSSYTYEDGSHYRAAVMDANPYGYWRFEETGGDAFANEVPSSLGGEKATMVGDPTGADGVLAGMQTNAMDAGAGAYAELPESILHRIGTRLTVEAWFSTTEHGTVIGALDKPTSPTERSQLIYVGTDGRLRAQFWTTTGGVDPITTDSAVNDGQWHHVALTSDGTTQTLYLDGEEIGTKSGQVEHRNTKFVYAGHGMGNSGWPATLPSLGNFPFQGQIDEVAIYQRPLHPDTVALHHASGLDPADRLKEVITPEGNRAAHLSFDESTSRVQIHNDHNGGKWVYSDRLYNGDVNDEEAQVTAEVTITDPRGAASSSRYDALAGHRRVTDTDQLGHQTTYDYDTGGFLAETTLPNGAQLRFFNDERGNRLGQMSCRDLEATDCHWEWFSYHHDPDDPFDPRNDQLVSRMDARSENFLDTTYRTWWGYNSYGDQISETGPATEDFPDGRTVRYFYTDDTEPATDGGTAPAGLLVESWDADEGKTRFSYNTHGDITRVREPSGLVTEYTYDGLGRVVESTVFTEDHPDGITTAFTYDNAGRVLTETGPAVTNELTGTTHQERTSHVYDKDGNPIRQTVSDLTGDDPDRLTMLAYNRYGHLVARTDPEGNTEHYGYDFTGAQTYHQDAAGTEFRTTYTDRGHVAEHIVEGWVGHPDEDNAPAPLVLESHSYDPNGNLASTTDAVGRTTSYTYYADGLPAQTIATGAMLNDSEEPQDLVLEEHFYDPAGNPVRTVTGDGTTRTDMVWDEASRLASETLDPEGLARTTSYTYDALDNVLEAALTDPSGRVERVRYAYDPAGRLIEEAVQADGEELLTSYEVNELGLVTAITDPRGNEDGASAADFTTRMAYDELGRLTEERLPEVEIERHGEPTTTGRPTSRFGYDLVGNLTHQLDAEGNTSVFGYDLLGQQTDAQAPTFDGADGEPVTPRARTSYDALGRMVEQTDALGNTRTYTWDQLGNLARITDPELTGHTEAGEWIYFYNPVGEMLAAVDPLEARTEATYDDLGRQVTDTQIERLPAAAAYTTRFTYDVMGNPVSITDPLGNASTSAYNAVGELIEEVNAAGEATKFEYDLSGRLHKVTDPAGTQAVSEFDLSGRPVRTRILDAEDNELRSESTEYDAAGLPIKQTDPNGNVVRTEYNAQGLPTSLIEPVSDTQTITTSFGYNALGQQTRITDGRGNSTHTTYTPTGAVSSLIEPATDAAPELADRTWSTFYDAGGNPVRQEVPGGVVRARTYNELGGLTRETATGAAVTTEDRGFGYDLLGRPTQIGTPEGRIEIVYDDRGNQVQFLGPDSVSFEGMAPGTTISYDAAGRANTRLDVVTGTTTFGYDAAGRVIEQHDPVTGTDLSVDYDQTGQVASVTTDDGAVRSFSYDPLSQLTEDTLVSATGDTTVSTTYEYDAAGNITERSTQGTMPSGRHQYAYDQASRLISWTSPDEQETEYSWDASGNRVQAGAQTFEFDERNQLLSSSGGDTWSYNPDGTLKSQFVDGELRTPQFDGFERMVSVGNGSGEYSYDALGRVAEREAGSQEHTFVYQGLGNNPTAVLDGTDTPVSQYGRDVSGGLLSVADQGRAPALAYGNSHGDLIATHTSTGAVVTSTDFGPFGEQLGGALASSVGYQGEWTDPDTGDVNMHARWYQPGTGRFASRDTVTLEPFPSVQANRFTYGNANPVRYTDPSGHAIILVPLVPWAVSAGIAAGATAAAKGTAIIGAGAALAWGVNSAINSWTASQSRTSTATRTKTRVKTRTNNNSTTTSNIRNTGVASASARGSSIRWTGSPGVRWTGSGTVSFKGSGQAVSGTRQPDTRPIPVVIIDRRREILQQILNTPQPRPSMGSLVSQEDIDSERLSRERKIYKFNLSFNLEISQEFEKTVESYKGEPLGSQVGSEDCQNRREVFSGSNRWNEQKKAIGLIALLCDSHDFGEGTEANDSIYPPGWPGTPTSSETSNQNANGTWKYHRGHLGANSLGFSGDDPWNLVTMYARANNPEMEKIEMRVKRAVEGGQAVYMSVVPIYSNNQEMPTHIFYRAVGSGDLDVYSCIENTADARTLDGSACVDARSNRGGW